MQVKILAGYKKIEKTHSKLKKKKLFRRKVNCVALKFKKYRTILKVFFLSGMGGIVILTQEERTDGYPKEEHTQRQSN